MIRQLGYWGGLGDVINHIHWLPCYQNLDFMEPGDKAEIFLVSHNPSVKELFLWHPKRSQIELKEIGFFLDWLNPEARLKLGFMTDCDHVRPFSKVNFYPSETDLPIIDRIRAMGRYIVFAPSSAEWQKYVPTETTRGAAKIAVERGFKVVLLGKNYDHVFKDKDPMRLRQEQRLQPSPDVVDVIDQVTVPGSMKIIESASGVFCAHSFASMASFHLNRPTFLLYDKNAHDNYQPKDGKSYEGYLFGAGRSGNDHMWFPNYRPVRFEQFLDAIK